LEERPDLVFTHLVGRPHEVRDKGPRAAEILGNRTGPIAAQPKIRFHSLSDLSHGNLPWLVATGVPSDVKSAGYSPCGERLPRSGLVQPAEAARPEFSGAPGGRRRAARLRRTRNAGHSRFGAARGGMVRARASSLLGHRHAASDCSLDPADS